MKYSLLCRVMTVIVLTVFSFTADAGRHRSQKARAEFVRAHPCPATGKRHGACPGWVVDHVVALACGGRDHPSNMQWQTVEEAKLKDKVERRGCRKSG
jgi:hypothetical protein